MTTWNFRNADAARDAFRDALDFLFYKDGYSVEQLERDLIAPALEDFRREAEAAS